MMQPFSPAFFSMLALIFAAVLLLYLLFRRANALAKQALFCMLCGCGLVAFAVYKCYLAADSASLAVEFYWLAELPLQPGTINLLLLPVGVLSNKRTLLGFSFYAATAGALIAMLYPPAAFCGYSVLVPRVFGYYLTNSLLLLCGLCLPVLNLYRPRLRDTGVVTASFLVLSLSAHMGNTLLHFTFCPQANYFLTYGYATGILHELWELIPYPYIFELPLILLLLAVIFLVSLPFELAARCRRAADRV